MKIKDFIKKHYRHFNAAVISDASEAYVNHLDKGGKMFVTLAGAMSTAELGLSLAEMIRQDKIHGICCTGANLEEDVFNLVAHEHYERIPEYRNLSDEAERELLKRNMNRVTDTCIPEAEAMRRIEQKILPLWRGADADNKSFFPHEFFYEMIRNGSLKEFYQIDPKDSWLVAASEKDLPIYVPGWEDSTLGNAFVCENIQNKISKTTVVKSGLDQMIHLVSWYQETSKHHSIGFFQIGGGIAGDFPICVVPLIQQDLKLQCPLWGYFCQISDSTTSYGSYSGAVPNEKITWGKLDINTPRFIIESDATIVAPLIFSYVLDQ